MAHREGSVFIYLFVATLVIVVALVAAVLIMKAENDELVGALNKADKDAKSNLDTIRDRTKDVSDLRILVAGTDDGWPGNQFFADKLREVEEKMNTLMGELGGQNVPSYEGLVDPYQDYSVVLAKLKSSWDSETERTKKSLKDFEFLRNTTEDQLKELRDRNTELQENLRSCERTSEDNDQQLRQRIQELTDQLADEQDRATERELESKKLLAFEQNKVSQLLNRIERLEAEKNQEKTIEDIEPDGQILEVEPRSRIAWVNLGRKQHMRPGLVFRVFQYVGGKKEWKGSIEIRRVDDDYSQGRIIEEIDGLNPLAANDHVTSPFYDPKVSPVFVFAGEKVANAQYPKSYLVKKLESFGARVSNEVKIDTDFLVALADYETTPEYRTAKELGVTVLRELDLIDYLGQ